jgi:hypothetical protein
MVPLFSQRWSAVGPTVSEKSVVIRHADVVASST